MKQNDNTRLGQIHCLIFALEVMYCLTVSKLKQNSQTIGSVIAIQAICIGALFVVHYLPMEEHHWMHHVQIENTMITYVFFTLGIISFPASLKAIFTDNPNIILLPCVLACILCSAAIMYSVVIWMPKSFLTLYIVCCQIAGPFGLFNRRGSHKIIYPPKLLSPVS